ncbi:LiaI-LiaF-like domain-containing protein [Halalkalibacter urbisdiaboli]|uniref:LiaI-LiaF-like domain-containing protein n=1 Tax=Halalkalibacter urbisdiaboli TaxID=1960589 RepID=UPI000B451232|nr:DUF5668 domain-containing protein [Halalkalibacter urbisdiaboli]
MRRQSIYPGFMLIGIGGYFLLQAYPLPFSKQLLTWPTLFLLIGIALLFQAYTRRDYSLLLPGWLLFGLGIHFHGRHLLNTWPSHWAVFTFILGCSFLLLYLKTKKEGLVLGLIFVFISLIMFTSLNPFLYFQKISSFLGNLWPLLFIAIGIFFMTKHK